MSRDESLRNHLHQAMHRLPGVPGHDRAEELNTNQSGRVRAVKTNEAGRARAKRWSTSVNEAGARAAVRRHTAPPRVLVGVQEFIARLAGRGE